MAEEQSRIEREKRLEYLGTLGLSNLAAGSSKSVPKTSGLRNRIVKARGSKYLTSGRSLDATEDVKNYLGTLNPRIRGKSASFVPVDLSAALDISMTQERPVFIFLESPIADASKDFPERFLSSEAISAYLSRNFICWAVTLRDNGAAEGYQLAKKMRFQDFSESIIAVVGGIKDDSKSNMEHRVILRVISSKIASFRNPEEFLEWIVIAEEQWKKANAYRNAEKSRSEIVRSQNYEYEMALRQDEMALKEEQRKERETKLLEQKEKEKLLERKRLKESLPPEPKTNEPNVARIRMLFPDGNTKLDRNFRLNEPAKILLNFIRSNEIFDRSGKEIEAKNIRVVTRFPRSVININSEESLRSVGVKGACVLCVEEIFK